MNIFVIVVCYFGGILLGVFGLINVYKNSVVEVFLVVVIIEKIVEEKYIFSFDYVYMSKVMNVVFKELFRIVE